MYLEPINYGSNVFYHDHSMTGIKVVKYFENLHRILNKAIRDGKYLARHMPVLGSVHPIKIENVDIFFVTSFLCSLEFLYY